MHDSIAEKSCEHGAMTMTTMHNPASPGELLREFLGDITITQLAEHIGVARATVSRILNGRTAVTTDLSIRLGEALALSPDFFSKAQLQYELWIESQKKRRKIKPLAAGGLRIQRDLGIQSEAIEDEIRVATANDRRDCIDCKRFVVLVWDHPVSHVNSLQEQGRRISCKGGSP